MIYDTESAKADHNADDNVQCIDLIKFNPILFEQILYQNCCRDVSVIYL